MAATENNPLRTEVCGAIASGKSTYVRHNAEGLRPVYEDFEKNPFLFSFYANPAAYSFETEMTFLLLHYSEIKDAVKAGVPFICDFSLTLDRAFAGVTLPRKKLRAFIQVADQIENEIGLPDRIVYLTCPVDTLLQRVRQRQRSFEQGISLQYLGELVDSIEAQISLCDDRIEIVRVSTT